ncbi:uncharacterized protein si:ch211-89o9.6 [Danio rerio]|uniref:Si:ch211-89o9.6 n=1 Tax=Danio rerio TaxID=7955 RepID=F1QV78_DANRE|nr:zinc finger protein 354B [Danio rerio]|eukprot:XP_687655.4 zinc finger protein 354B [Danio rerio]
MSSRIAFQTQLASIMEVLANAAVAEICKLVDDDYAVINLQMSQCQRENKALKRKLHVLELKMARGFAERRISSLNRANRVQVSTALSDKYRNQSNDGLYGNQFNTGLWRGGRTDSTPQEAVNESDSGAGDAVLPDAETLLIKDEMFEDHQTQQRLFIRDDGITETSQTGEPGFGDVQKDDDQVSGMQHTNLEQGKVEYEEPETIVIKEDLNDQWEISQAQTITVQDVESNKDICSKRLSTSPTKPTVAPGTEKPIELEFSHFSKSGQKSWGQKSDTSSSTGLQMNLQGTAESSPSSSQQHQFQNFAARPNKSLTTIKITAVSGSEQVHKGIGKSRNSPTNQPSLTAEKTAIETADCLLIDKPAEHKTSFTHWPTQPSHSYSDSNQDEDCVLVQSETVTSIRNSKSGQDGSSFTQTHPAAERPLREEERWNQAGIFKQSQTDVSGHIGRPEAIQKDTPNRSSASYFTVIPQTMSNLTQPGASLAGPQLPKRMEKGRRRSYVCKYCGKAFPGLSNVVAHQRVHTGERPFRCDICGKLFAEAGNLKKHQRVHTGEKPFTCPRCGKQFAWICNLKTHQQSASCGAV